MNYQIKTFSSASWIIPAGAPDPSNQSDVKFAVTHVNGEGLKPDGKGQDIKGTISLQWQFSSNAATAQITVPAGILFDGDRKKLQTAWQEFLTNLDTQADEAFKYMIAGGPAIVASLLLQHIPLKQSEVKNYNLRFGFNDASYIDLLPGMRLKMAFSSYYNEEHKGSGAQFKGFSGSGVTYAYVQSGVGGNYLSFNSFMDVQQADVTPPFKPAVEGIRLIAGVIDLAVKNSKAYYRLFYPAGGFTASDKPDLSADHSISLAGTSAYKDLPLKPVANGAKCVISLFYGRCYITPEIQIKVNGKPTYIAAGTTLKHLLEANALAGMLPKQLNILRYQDYQKSKVHFVDPAINSLDLYLLPGDDISWVASANFALIERAKAIYRITDPSPLALALGELTIKSFGVDEDVVLPVMNDMAVALLESHTTPQKYSVQDLGFALYTLNIKHLFQLEYKGEDFVYALYFAGFDVVEVGYGTLAGYTNIIIADGGTLVYYLLQSGVGYSINDVTAGVYKSLNKSDRTTAPYLIKALILGSAQYGQLYNPEQIARVVYEVIGDYKVETAFELVAALLIGSNLASSAETGDKLYNHTLVALIVYKAYLNGGVTLTPLQLAKALAAACKGQPLAYNATTVAAGLQGVYPDLTPVEIATALRICDGGYTMTEVSVGTYSLSYYIDGQLQKIAIDKLVSILAEVYKTEPENLFANIAAAVFNTIAGVDVKALAAAMNKTFLFVKTNPAQVSLMVQTYAVVYNYAADKQEEITILAKAIAEVLSIVNQDPERGDFNLSRALIAINGDKVPVLINATAISETLTYDGSSVANVTRLVQVLLYAYSYLPTSLLNAIEIAAVVAMVIKCDKENTAQLLVFGNGFKEGMGYQGNNSEQVSLAAIAMDKALTQLSHKNLSYIIFNAFGYRRAYPEQYEVNNLGKAVKDVYTQRGKTQNETELLVTNALCAEFGFAAADLKYQQRALTALITALVFTFGYKGDDDKDVLRVSTLVISSLMGLSADLLAAGLVAVFGYVLAQEQITRLGQNLSTLYNYSATNQEQLNKLAGALIQGFKLDKTSQDHGKYLSKALLLVKQKPVTIEANATALAKTFYNDAASQSDATTLLVVVADAYSLVLKSQDNINTASAALAKAYGYDKDNRAQLLLLGNAIKQAAGFKAENPAQVNSTAIAIKNALPEISIDNLWWTISTVFDYHKLPVVQAEVNAFAGVLKSFYNDTMQGFDLQVFVGKTLSTTFDFSCTDQQSVNTLLTALVITFDFKGSSDDDIETVVRITRNIFPDITPRILVTALKIAFNISGTEEQIIAMAKSLNAVYGYDVNSQADINTLADTLKQAFNITKDASGKSLAKALFGIGVPVNINAAALASTLFDDRINDADKLIEAIVYAYSFSASVQTDVDTAAQAIAVAFEYDKDNRGQLLALGKALVKVFNYQGAEKAQVAMAALGIDRSLTGITPETLTYTVFNSFGYHSLPDTSELIVLVGALRDVYRGKWPEMPLFDLQSLIAKNLITVCDFIQTDRDDATRQLALNAFVFAFALNFDFKGSDSNDVAALIKLVNNALPTADESKLLTGLMALFGYSAINEDQIITLTQALNIAHACDVNNQDAINRMAALIKGAFNLDRNNADHGRSLAKALFSINVPAEINAVAIKGTLFTDAGNDTDKLITSIAYAYSLSSSSQDNVNTVAAVAARAFEFKSDNRDQLLILGKAIKKVMDYKSDNPGQVTITAVAIDQSLAGISAETLTWVIFNTFEYRSSFPEQYEINNLAKAIKIVEAPKWPKEAEIDFQVNLGRYLSTVFEFIPADKNYQQRAVEALAGGFAFAFDFKGDNDNQVATLVMILVNVLPDIKIDLLAIAFVNIFRYETTEEQILKLLRNLDAVFSYSSTNQDNMNTMAGALVAAFKLSQNNDDQCLFLSQALLYYKIPVNVNGIAISRALALDGQAKRPSILFIAVLLRAYGLSATMQDDVTNVAKASVKAFGYRGDNETHIEILANAIKIAFGYGSSDADGACITAVAMLNALENINFDIFQKVLARVFTIVMGYSNHALVYAIMNLTKATYNLQNDQPEDVIKATIYTTAILGSKPEDKQFQQDASTTLTTAIVKTFNYADNQEQLNTMGKAMIAGLKVLDVTTVAFALIRVFHYDASNPAQIAAVAGALTAAYNFNAGNQDNMNDLAKALRTTFVLDGKNHYHGKYLSAALSKTIPFGNVLTNARALVAALNYTKQEDDTINLACALQYAYNISNTSQGDVNTIAATIETIWSFTQDVNTVRLGKALAVAFSFNIYSRDQVTILIKAIYNTMPGVAAYDMAEAIALIYVFQRTYTDQPIINNLASALKVTYSMRPSEHEEIAGLSQIIARIFNLTQGAPNYAQAGINALVLSLKAALDYIELTGAVYFSILYSLLKVFPDLNIDQADAAFDNAFGSHKHHDPEVIQQLFEIMLTIMLGPLTKNNEPEVTTIVKKLITINRLSADSARDVAMVSRALRKVLSLIAIINKDVYLCFNLLANGFDITSKSKPELSYVTINNIAENMKVTAFPNISIEMMMNFLKSVPAVTPSQAAGMLRELYRLPINNESLDKLGNLIGNAYFNETQSNYSFSPLSFAFALNSCGWVPQSPQILKWLKAWYKQRWLDLLEGLIVNVFNDDVYQYGMIYVMSGKSPTEVTTTLQRDFDSDHLQKIDHKLINILAWCYFLSDVFTAATIIAKAMKAAGYDRAVVGMGIYACYNNYNPRIIEAVNKVYDE